MGQAMASGWSDPVDAYCERIDASFWSEPLNALSNAAFILAAAAAFLRWRRAGAGDGPALYLIVIVAAVGIGSFLFHTFANRWSRLADVIPILVVIYSYFGLAMRRFLGLGLPAAVAATAAFGAFNLGFERAWAAAFGLRGLELTNHSVGYFSAAMALLGVGAALIGPAFRAAGSPALAEARRRAGRALVAAAAVFVLSLSFRMVDLAVCPRLPFGTHFLWHMLNALVLFILLAAAIRFRAEATRE